MNEIKINNKIKISNSDRPKIVAEISCNHNGNKKNFLNHIIQSNKAGADLIKIQTYEPQDMTIKNYSKNFLIKEGKWKKKYIWDLYKKTQTPLNWHDDAFQLAKDIGATLFSTPFSKRCVDFLEKKNIKIYKIASFELEDFSLVDYVAQTKKPIIISTGISNINVVKECVKLIKKYHSKIIILHCVSGYPTNIENSNLNRVLDLKNFFRNSIIGLSDHTDSIYTSLSSLPLGIGLIEKHFIINKKNKTEDLSFSIDYNQLKTLVQLNKSIFKSLQGSSKKNKLIKYNKYFKRSIYLKKNVKKGDIISDENIIALRPNLGINASNYFKIIGKKFKKNLNANCPLKLKDIIT